MKTSTEHHHRHDLMVSCENLTPSECKKKGEGLVIHYGSYHSPFGQCVIATTHRWICKLAFFDTHEQHISIETALHAEWPKATITKNDQHIRLLADTIFIAAEKSSPLKILLKGSPFQLKVWQALLSIPKGELKSYQDIAFAIEKPTATRAVASAIAKNNIAYLIPCHRVIKQNGDFGQYRWNSHRKQALITWETGRHKLKVNN